MNYVFRYVGQEWPNDNRFFNKIDNGVIYTSRGALHAPQFSSDLIDIPKMAYRLGLNYKAELWTPELLREPFFKNQDAHVTIIGMVFITVFVSLLGFGIFELFR